METAIISRLVHAQDYALVEVQGVLDQPGIAARLFRALADEGVNIEEIIQNVSRNHRTDIGFMTARDDAQRSHQAIADRCADMLDNVVVSEDFDVYGLYGACFKTDPTVLARFTECFSDAGANINIMTTSSLRLTGGTSSTHRRKVTSFLEAEFLLTCEHRARLD